MHEMKGKRAAPPPIGELPGFAEHQRRFPATAWLRRYAPSKVPLFAFEFGDTGAGNDLGIAHNWAALDAVQVVPRYGVMPTLPPVDVKLFGRSYAAPIGVAPIGGASLVWPGADLLMAKAAQRACVPYTLSVAGGATIEQAAEAAPDVFWVQLYRFWHDDHKIGFTLCGVRKQSMPKCSFLLSTFRFARLDLVKLTLGLRTNSVPPSECSTR
jgi:(S)-mandelate dehydrogenase